MKNLVLAMVLLSSFVFADRYEDWTHHTATLYNESNSSDQISVSFDYKLTRDSSQYGALFATPLYVNVFKKFNGSERVRLVLTNYSWNSYGINWETMKNRTYETMKRFEGTYEKDLWSASNDHFTADFGEALHVSGFTEAPGCYKCGNGLFQEVAILIDGQVYKGQNGLDYRMNLGR